MKGKQYLVRILPPLAFLAACVVLISALFEPLFTLTLAGACFCTGIAYLMYHTGKSG